MPEILEIHHVQIAIPHGGEGLARQFYGGILGLRELPKPAALADRGGCWFELADGTCRQLHLGVDPSFVASTKAHVAFRVSHARRLASAIESSGHTVLDEPMDGFHRFYADDPFGNRLEFLQEIE